MKTRSWILVIISFLPLPIGILIGYFCNQIVCGTIFAIVFYMIFSYVAHQLSIAIFFYGNHFPYYITLFGAIIPFIIVFFFYYIVIGFNMILCFITQKNCLNHFICWMQTNLLYKSPAKSISNTKIDNTPKSFTIVQLNKYTLTLDIDLIRNNPNSKYLRFKDNFGDYWRSYNHKKTFIREKDFLILSAKENIKFDTENDV